MKFKEFIQKYGTGSPFSRREGKFAVTKSGYKFNSNIFYTFIGLICLMGFYIFYSVGFSLDDQIYYKCDQTEQCPNPFYMGTDIDIYEPAYKILTKEQKAKCKGDWCKEAYLPGGFEYGEPPSPLARNFMFYAFGLISFAFILNHLMYNLKFNNEADNN